jgi:hypothetical protein
MTSNYARIENTVVSGASLIGSLTNDDMTALQFRNNSQNDAVVVPTGTTGVFLEPSQLVKAAAVGIGQQCNCEAVGVANSVGHINLGSDTARVAQNYQRLLNLTTNTDSRILSFNLALSTNGSLPAAVDLRSVSGGAGTFVRVSNNGTEGAAANLFATGAYAGDTLRVAARGRNFNSGSNIVAFAVVEHAHP